ncbi:galectin-4-like isoform X2 [Brienomyrus brachyistius]|uniref:galectin-4-like isoform X1 n=1 Tax=Brienomyrus brachyistius TaxID=42636 RepID=UPI0020B3A6A4|nr:galectin-4-like isoform X1 [Brienomyrus brachyistius]XP_048836246.1 galectin-4-like isoform X2 [Brienomyrus brachyistius]
MAFMPPPGYLSVYNPCIPYLGPINGGLRPGMSIYIQGHLPHHMKRFFCNLQCGEMEGSDIALHINPRFDGWDKVVFNSFQCGTWQEEEKIHRMPFSKGQLFELIIIVECEGYQVNINGTRFHLFRHRLPMEMVYFLNIGGEVIIQTLNIIGGSVQGFPGGMGGVYPAGGMGGGFPAGGMPGGYSAGVMAGGFPDGGMGGMAVGMPGLPGMGGQMGYPGGNLPMMASMPVYNPSVPYVDFIPGGLTHKRTIIIRGMVPFGANRFTINFKVAGSDDIAFHLTPRMMEGVVMRNSYLGGWWGQEENDISFCPFQQGQYFEISIRCGNRRYKVYVNGQHLCNFTHRIHPFGKVDRLEVIGDVQLSYIHF